MRPSARSCAVLLCALAPAGVHAGGIGALGVRQSRQPPSDRPSLDRRLDRPEQPPPQLSDAPIADDCVPSADEHVLVRVAEARASKRFLPSLNAGTGEKDGAATERPRGWNGGRRDRTKTRTKTFLDLPPPEEVAQEVVRRARESAERARDGARRLMKKGITGGPLANPGLWLLFSATFYVAKARARDARLQKQANIDAITQQVQRLHESHSANGGQRSRVPTWRRCLSTRTTWHLSRRRRCRG